MNYRELFLKLGVNTDQICVKDDKCIITVNMSPQEKQVFCESILEINIKNNNVFQIEELSERRATIYFESKWMKSLIDSLNKAPNDTYRVESWPYYDLKLGYSCNNNCIHCVIKPNIFRIQETNPDEIVLDSDFGMWCRTDLTYTQVLEQFNTEVFKNAKIVTLTGGEPTIRNDFIDILKWLNTNRPDMRINLQTNGRRLCDLDFVKAIKRYASNISFLIAVHSSDEHIHNKVVNNRKEEGNPFVETINGIKNVQLIFKDSHQKRIEIETVLSNVNYTSLFNTIKDLHEVYNIANFKFSYPDMQDYEIQTAEEIAPPYQMLGIVLKDVNNYCKENRDIRVIFEDIPACVLRHFLGSDIFIRDTVQFKTPRNLITINAVGSINDMGIFQSERHIKLEQCKYCGFNEHCQGLWPETLKINEIFISNIIDKL